MVKHFRYSGVLRQLLAVIAGDLAMTAAGTVMAWTSPALPKMALTPSQESWAGSLPSLGAAVGPWLGGWLSDRLGRKVTVLLGAIPIASSWAALLFCERRPAWLCAVRFVSGLGVGLTYTAMPTYVAEVAQADVRGGLSSLIVVSMSIGYMIDYCVGPFVSYTTLAIVGLATPVVAAACFAWMPESPYYLLAVGKDAAAEESLRWLRDPDRDIASELREMKIPLAVFFTLSDAHKDVGNIGWIPVTALLLYVIVYTPGYGCLPFTVSGEIFPPNVKIVAMPMAASVSWLMSFVITRFYGDIALAVGNGGPFFVFSGCALLVTAYVFFVVPETKGKTLEEIQEMLGKE